MPDSSFQLGSVRLRPRCEGDRLQSLGEVSVNGRAFRSDATRFLPWFDSHAGDVFRDFQLREIDDQRERVTFHLRACSDPDQLFRQQRDSSGDLVFRQAGWDAEPRVVDLRAVFEPASLALDGRTFEGLRYWFEIDSPALPLHRFIDRQSWELGGNLDRLTLLCRNWMTPTRVRLDRDAHFTTAAMEMQSGLLPGSMWARWTLLPAFDMQYNGRGVLLGYFDQVANIRSVLQTAPGEEALRVVDVHHQEATEAMRTVAKTIVFNGEPIDDLEAINLWTRMQDREAERARRQLAVRDDGPPALILDAIQWVDYRFDKSYEQAVDVAGEFGLDHVYIDVIWEQMEALNEEVQQQTPGDSLARRTHRSSMCSVLDYRVAEVHGGIDGLAELCRRAAEHNVGILSWMAAHLSPNTGLDQRRPELADPAAGGLFAMKESGSHPDSGYPRECWPLNLNGPVFDYVLEQIREVQQRTGIAGFLWDSFSNIGWWQVNYANGTMRPQWDRFAELFRRLAGEGMYLLSEGMNTFSNHSSLGAFGENDFSGEMAPFAYNTHMALLDTHGGDGRPLDQRILAGDESIEPLFRAYSHRHTPTLTLHRLPRDRRDPRGEAALKRLFRAYRACRQQMVHRTVLPDDMGVQWAAGDATHDVLWVYRPLRCDTPVRPIFAEQQTTHLDAWQVYRLPRQASLHLAAGGASPASAAVFQPG